MKKNTFSNEFIFQVFALLIAFIIVHAFYVSMVRPAAAVHLQQQAEMIKENPEYITKDSFFVVIKDYEQEACFILMFWAFSHPRL